MKVSDLFEAYPIGAEDGPPLFMIVVPTENPGPWNLGYVFEKLASGGVKFVGSCCDFDLSEQEDDEDV